MGWWKAKAPLVAGLLVRWWKVSAPSALHPAEEFCGDRIAGRIAQHGVGIAVGAEGRPVPAITHPLGDGPGRIDGQALETTAGLAGDEFLSVVDAMLMRLAHGALQRIAVVPVQVLQFITAEAGVAHVMRQAPLLREVCRAAAGVDHAECGW